jgi:beta-mannosidase
MSEYGFQGFPPVQSIKKFINQKKFKLDSKKLSNHQKHSRGMKIIHDYMKNYYTVPEKVKDFVYISQLLQAEGITKGIEAHRRHKPYCMGTLYWQLNDCWPAISWSSVDYYDNWKALHYKARETFKNIIISTKEEADSVKIWLINDDFEDYKGKLHLRLLDFEGEEIWQKTINIKLEKDTSKQVYAQSRKKILQDHIPATVLLKTTLQINDDKSDHDLFYFTAPKHLKLIDPEIEYSLEKKENHFEIELTSNYLAKNVHLTVPYAGNFSKNYFDLLPGEKDKVIFSSDISIEKFRKNLSIKSLSDCQR